MTRLSGRGELPTASEDIIQKPVRYHNRIVGWVISNAADKISREADINFDRQQHITRSLVTMFSLLVALITTFLLARNFLKPIKHILEEPTSLPRVILLSVGGYQAEMNLVNWLKILTS